MEVNTKVLLEQAKRLDKVITWSKKLSSVLYKIEKQGEDEVLTRRKEKLTENPLSEKYMEIVETKLQMSLLEDEIDVVRPLVFDKEEGKNPENHEKLSVLTDKFKEKQEHYDELMYAIEPEYRGKYAAIYDTQLNGAEIDVIKDVLKTFKKLQKGKISSVDGAIHGSKYSEDRYNLPKGFYAQLIDYSGKKKYKKK